MLCEFPSYLKGRKTWAICGCIMPVWAERRIRCISEPITDSSGHAAIEECLQIPLIA